MTTLYESYEEIDATADIYGAVVWGAQSFTPSITHILTKVSIFCYKVVSGGEVGDLTIGIYLTDEDGYPTGSVLCSGSISGDSITSDSGGEWKEVTLNTPYILEATVQYAIVIDARSGSATAKIVWKVDSVGSYVNGVFSTSADSGSSWTGSPGEEYDGTFKEYGDTVPTTLPAIELSLQALWGW